MVNVLDSLVIQLGLDPKGVKSGANQVKKDLKGVEDSAGKTEKALASTGRGAAEGFSQARNQALALLAVFTGGRSLKNFVMQTTEANAQLGYMAQRLNMNPQRLWAMQRAVVAMGGSAEEVASSFNTMQQMLTTPEGSARLQNVMGQLGVRNYTDAQGNLREDVLRRLNVATQGMNQARKNNLLGQLGLGPGEINLIDQTTAAFDKLYASRLKIAPSNQEIADGQRFSQDMAQFRDDSQKLGRVLEAQVIPPLDHMIRAFTEFEEKHPDISAGIVGLTVAFTGLSAVLLTVAPLISSIVSARNIAALAALKGAASGGAAAAESAGATAIVAGRMHPYLLAKTALGETPRLALRATGIGAFLATLFDPTAANGAETSMIDKLRQRGKIGGGLFGAYAASVAGIEHAGYGQMGGAGGSYAGKYQLGAAAIADAARRLHERVPTRAQFLSDPAMQERYFRAFTESNADYLSAHSDRFRSASDREKLAILGYAHNQGAGGALDWLNTGRVGHDAFGTAGTRYSDAILNATSNSASSPNIDNSTQTHVGDVHVTVNGNANGQQIGRAIKQELSRTLPAQNIYGQA